MCSRHEQKQLATSAARTCGGAQREASESKQITVRRHEGTPPPCMERQNDEASSDALGGDALGAAETVTMVDVLREEEQLLDAAGQALEGTTAPPSPSSRALGQRERVHLSERIGVCFGCSMNCHLNCRLEECYSKHGFRCDCECTCLLTQHGVVKEDNTENRYGHNFEGRYCICDKPYHYETDTMHQCICCDEWFHEACIGKYDGDAYDLLCSSCSPKPLFHELFAKYAPLNASVVELKNSQRDGGESCSAEPTPPLTEAVCPFGTHPPVARHTSTEVNGVPRHPSTTLHLQDAETHPSSPQQQDTCTGVARFLLLPHGWQKMLCFCDKCLALYRSFPEQYVIFDSDDDEQKEAAQDPCDDVFGEERGRDAVEETITQNAAAHFQALPFPVQAALSREFSQLQNDLKKYLREFVESGRAVTREDVEHFFAEQSAKRPRLE